MTTSTPPAEPLAPPGQPDWVGRLNTAYRGRKKHLIVLTGNVGDLQWSPGVTRFVSLEQAIYQATCRAFLPVKFDAANGITFFDQKDEDEFVRGVQLGLTGKKAVDVKAQIAACRHEPLTALVLLRECAEAIANARLLPENVDKFRRLVIVVDFAAAIFPSGELGGLSELDRQRLVTFLGWAGSPFLARSGHLIVLVAETKTEINGRIFSLPQAAQIEIDLPSDAERAWFTRQWLGEDGKKVEFEGGQDTFVNDTAGMKLVTMEDVLEGAAESETPLSRESVLVELNRALVAELGEFVRVEKPAHTADDIIGQGAAKKRLLQTLKRCENPSTAVGAVMITGSNGVGKTFVVKGCANTGGWIMLVLSGLRDKWVGEMDRKFEKLLLVLKRFRRVIIYVEEARATMGSVHREDAHETERRMMGYIISMMSNKAYRGRVVWFLDTARPDVLDPDIQRRAPIQIGIFDPVGDERRVFVAELLKRNGLSCSDEDLDQILRRTEKFSASDYDTLVTLAKGDGVSVLEVLGYWEAIDISVERSFQALVASLHCTYRELIPEHIRSQDPNEVRRTIEEFKALRGI